MPVAGAGTHLEPLLGLGSCQDSRCRVPEDSDHHCRPSHTPLRSIGVVVPPGAWGTFCLLSGGPASTTEEMLGCVIWVLRILGFQ